MDLFNPSHLSIRKPDLNSVGVVWRICEYIRNYSFCKRTGVLVLF